MLLFTLRIEKWLNLSVLARIRFIDKFNSKGVDFIAKNSEIILSSRTRSEKMIMKDLKDSIKEKLDWLNCRILVENINTHLKDIYSANIV